MVTHRSTHYRVSVIWLFPTPYIINKYKELFKRYERGSRKTKLSTELIVEKKDNPGFRFEEFKRRLYSIVHQYSRGTSCVIRQGPSEDGSNRRRPRVQAPGLQELTAGRRSVVEILDCHLRVQRICYQYLKTGINVSTYSRAHIYTILVALYTL